MFNSNSAPSLSDIAAVVGNDNGFGSNGGWWPIIILFALFGGFGNGFGNRYGGGGVSDGYILTSDFANIERKLDGVNNGLCDGFYAQNTGMLTGFNNVGSAITNSTNTLGNQLTALSTQLAQCCCDNRAATADVKYTMATDQAALLAAISQMTQTIMQNDNNNYRALHDENIAAQMAAKDETIARLREQITRHEINDSNLRQTAEIVGAIRPAAVPAYTVPNPYYGYGYMCQNAC